MGKTPLDLAAETPSYQKSLRDFIFEEEVRRKKKGADPSEDAV